MAVSKAQQKAQNKWIAKAYDRVNLTLPKGQKEVVQAHAAAHDESVNGFIGRAINEAMERDGTRGPQEADGMHAADPAGKECILPMDTLQAVQEAAQAAGQSVHGYILQAITERLEHESAVSGAAGKLEEGGKEAGS